MSELTLTGRPVTTTTTFRWPAKYQRQAKYQAARLGMTLSSFITEISILHLAALASEEAKNGESSDGASEK